MIIEKLVRPNIKALKPYRSARQDHLNGVLLDANENSYGSPVTFDGLDLHRYPDPYQSVLRDRLAGLNNMPARNLFIGAGSDEIIDLLFRIFCEPSVDNVIIPVPTYGMYKVSADIHNVRVITSLLTDEFQLDVPDILDKFTGSTKMIFCCSPNNPTGNLFLKNDILRLCNSTESLIVVDEAYIEFAESNSLSEHIAEYPNLVVMRTLSKSWGLAGLRLGYCIAHEKVVEYLLKIKAPYNVNSVSAELALPALDAAEKRAQIVQEIRNERNRLMNRLDGFGYVRKVFSSDANFILVRVDDANRLFDHLIVKGIVVRNRTTEPKLEGCIRITVGTPRENDLLLDAMEGFRK